MNQRTGQRTDQEVWASGICLTPVLASVLIAGGRLAGVARGFPRGIPRRIARGFLLNAFMRKLCLTLPIASINPASSKFESVKRREVVRVREKVFHAPRETVVKETTECVVVVHNYSGVIIEINLVSGDLIRRLHDQRLQSLFGIPNRIMGAKIGLQLLDE